jgi:8-amino-7-oxononanoate synthase
MSLASRWEQLLDELRAQGRYRHLAPPAGIDFSSNDYLGYGQNLRPESEALSRSGMASRLLRGHYPLWDEVETALAVWHGAEAALVMNSGYVANEGLLATVIDANDWVASDQSNHASIIDGLRLTKAERFVYRHNDLTQLEDGLRSAHAARTAGRELFIVTESLFGMDGDVAPLAAIVALAERYHASVIVDEAHATGCFGAIGSGLVDQLGLRSRVVATVHTGGKALAVPGAYIAGSRLLKELLVNRCRHLIFTTALPPQVGSWWQETLERVQIDEAARSRLHANVAEFRKALTAAGVPAGGAHYIIPIDLSDDARTVQAAQQLQASGFDIRAIRPPTVPPGTARLRISIHADHSPELLAGAAAALVRSWRGDAAKMEPIS